MIDPANQDAQARKTRQVFPHDSIHPFPIQSSLYNRHRAHACMCLHLAFFGTLSHVVLSPKQKTPLCCAITERSSAEALTLRDKCSGL
ncbi:hypothetical protein VTH06DRAFT_7800 [Thermothelomyces fergusii]